MEVLKQPPPERMGMASNVIKFPAKAARDWALIEKAIREQCSVNMFSPEVQKRLLEVMKPFWEMLDPGLNFSVDIAFPAYIREEDRAAITAAVSRDISRMNGEILNRFTNHLYIERLRREVDLCRDLGLIA